VNTNPADLEELEDFLSDAEQDTSARAGDPFDGTPLTGAFADSEWQLISKLRELITTDEQARAFVRRWRVLVENTAPDEYPQRRGAVFASTAEATWTIGKPRLRAAVTLWDAFVRDEAVTDYRTLGTVVED
jgi:hypothetical protein